MNRRRAAAVIIVGALATGACARGGTSAPVPAPPGAPPQVQAPIGSEPTNDPVFSSSASAPDPRVRRFEVVAAEDTTITILVGSGRWVRRGTVGIAVDPRRRDALVARFRVLAREGDSATALVTAQTTPVSTSLVALMREPIPAVLQQDAFWAGLFFGVGAGIAAALIVRR